MNFITTYRFWRPTLIVLGCYGLALLIGYVVSQQDSDEPSGSVLVAVVASVWMYERLSNVEILGF